MSADLVAKEDHTEIARPASSDQSVWSTAVVIALLLLSLLCSCS